MSLLLEHFKLFLLWFELNLLGVYDHVSGCIGCLLTCIKKCVMIESEWWNYAEGWREPYLYDLSKDMDDKSFDAIVELAWKRTIAN